MACCKIIIHSKSKLKRMFPAIMRKEHFKQPSSLANIDSGHSEARGIGKV